MIEQQLKKCIIHFKSDLDEGGRKKVTDYLESLGQFENIKVENRSLSLDYPFPLFTRNIIYTQLAAVFPDYAVSGSIWTSLKAYMEQNERDYIVFQPGWSRYVEDIYIHYFDQRHGGKRDVKNMLWRKYKKKRIEVNN